MLTWFACQRRKKKLAQKAALTYCNNVIRHLGRQTSLSFVNISDGFIFNHTSLTY